MSADSKHPLSSPNSRAPDEDQDQILAWEMAAFPDEEPLTWEELEYLEYLDETGPGDQEPPAATHSSPVLVGRPAATNPGATDAGGARAGAGFGHGGAADTMAPGLCSPRSLTVCGKTAWVAWMMMS